ncbi:MAG TPA: IS110 family transposase [Thermodesulfobacteriota bacterium]|nr:IS110 family transposase [Thermodesulfobacteriota bacterium]
MRGRNQGGKTAVRGEEVFVGIDVHKESWQVTVRAEGEEVFHGRIPGQYDALQKILDRFRGSKIKVGYEAGPCGFGLHDQLREDGVEVMVAAPSLIPVESGNRVKTDKRDSRKLARLLEGNLLKPVYVLSEEERMHRELLRTRQQIVGHRSDVARQIKSKLLFHGISSESAEKHPWTLKYVQWLKGLSLACPYLQESVGVLIDLYEYLSKQLRRINRRVAELSRADKYREKVKLLRTVPGVGLLTGMEVLVELQDVKRFRSSEEIASYLGLTPSEYSSGEKSRQGRITRSGNWRLRSALVESSWVLIARDRWMRMRYMKLKARKGAKRAIIAIARRLIIRLRSILLSNVPYRGGKPLIQGV